MKPIRKDRNFGDKRAMLRALIRAEGEACTNAIIFCNRKMDVDVVAKSLKSHGFNAAPIHGDLAQSERMKTLDAFRDHGVVIPLWRLHRAVGMGGDHFVAHVAGRKVDEAVGDAVRDAHGELFAAQIGRVAPLPGARDLIDGKIRGRLIVDVNR